jgi:8-oxo-dGTP pyrophosphatase MutT (NUDIX family)
VTDLARAGAEAALVAIVPGDDTERSHRADALAWVRSDAPVCRVAKPATPPKHLVSYVFLVDPHVRACLLVDHRLAQLWLPTGGHVDPGEHPASTATREAREELGIDPPPLEGLPSNPLFVTVTTTVGLDAGHVDVSLWYVCRGDATSPIHPDPREFASARWWDLDALATADPARFDPHLPRFVAKLSPHLVDGRGGPDRTT